jgi:hypothetical protein
MKPNAFAVYMQCNIVRTQEKARQVDRGGLKSNPMGMEETGS